MGENLTKLVFPNTTNFGLLKQIKIEKNSVESKDNETKIIMPMDNVFSSGNAISNETGKKWINDIVSSLKGKEFKEIRVEGQTDNSPINATLFPSNWELSTGRASDTVKYMVSKGIPSIKIVSIGYGENRPLVKNDTPENKAKNRRIEITIVGSIKKSK